MSVPTEKDIAQLKHSHCGPRVGEIYRHYKGGLYVVIARAIHEESCEPLVIYQSNISGATWARSLENFTSRVPVGIYFEPRFTRIVD